MASTFFGLHIGSSALSSFQVATNTTANNIANVKTTGYTRQEATLQAKDAIKADREDLARLALERKTALVSEDIEAELVYEKGHPAHIEEQDETVHD